jgi:hypothetical protein
MILSGMQAFCCDQTTFEHERRQSGSSSGARSRSRVCGNHVFVPAPGTKCPAP